MRYFIEFRISSTLTQVSYLNWKKLLISLMKSLSYTFSSLVFFRFNTLKVQLLSKYLL